MKRIAVIYWSGTGNTEKMAKEIYESVKSSKVTVDMMDIGCFDTEKIKEYDAIALGCPASGNEELEESEFAPKFEEIENELKDKKTILFGSYGWGGGSWMKEWEERCKKAGAKVINTVVCMDEPNNETIKKCRESGKNLLQLGL
ncbi:MAG: flavodoxin, partial [Ruminococcaceae bacterium]|nr:flavodoxin [Oscillospiraceae bacterium]